MKNIAALVVLVSLCLPANAEVSDDLKFCGDLKSRAERLACYDAAARIASRPAPVRPVAARVAPLDAHAAVPAKAAVPAEPLLLRNPFDGYYAAIGGGYGAGTRRDASLQGRFTSGFQDQLSLPTTAGASGDFAVGRNIALGWGLVGLELDGRLGGEGGSSTAVSSPEFFTAASGTAVSSYKYRNDAAFHAAVRVGAVFDDLMIFAKAGIGATRIRETFTSDERGISLFICPERSPLNGCYAPGIAPPGLNSTQVTSWLPSAIFGLGVEKNWGPVFGRLGADFEAVNHPTTWVVAPGISGSSSGAGQLTWTARGTAMIGVRF
jgi:hypothetical protein